MLSIILAIIIAGVIIVVPLIIFAIRDMRSRLNEETMGNFIIIEEPDEDPYVFLEINRTDFDAIMKQKTIMLNVIFRKNRSKSNSFNGKVVDFKKGEIND